MPNTSASGGYLLPLVATPPEEGVDLDALFQQVAVGVTGLAPDLVRPRWQPVTPKLPEPDVNWAGVGVKQQKADAGPYIRHDPDANGGLGVDTMFRHELVEVAFSFYGPLGQRYAIAMRDGLSIPQNLEALLPFGLKYRDALPVLSVPEQINNRWFKRYDFTIFFARRVTRVFGTENLESAAGVLVTDGQPPINHPFTVTH